MTCTLNASHHVSSEVAQKLADMDKCAVPQWVKQQAYVHGVLYSMPAYGVQDIQLQASASIHVSACLAGCFYASLGL